jgi:flagellar biosynthetic protein FliP
MPRTSLPPSHHHRRQAGGAVTHGSVDAPPQVAPARCRRLIATALVAAALCGPLSVAAQSVAPVPAQAPGIPFLDLTLREAQSNQELVLSLQLLLLLAVLSLAPSIMILTTSFLRLAIVFHFVKRALSLQEMPPNQVLMGVALFLTAFIMWPTFEEIDRDAVQPFTRGELSSTQLLQRAEVPVREFMFRQLGDDADNIRLFMSMRELPKPNTRADVPTYVLIPAFILHELTVAFKIGVLIFIPFVIIDMVVATTLISMGIIVLPPVLISLPFKLVLFVLVDGWDLLTMQVIGSFR